MKIAVLSDLHIGPKGKTDFLGHSDSSFVSFLKNLEQSYDLIVLNGDVIETLMPKKFGDYESVFQKAWKDRREITKRFETPKYKYIYGNHDMIAAKLVGAKEYLKLHHNDNSILFTHGYQADCLYNHNIGNKLVYYIGKAIHLGIPPAFHKNIYKLESSRHIKNYIVSKGVQSLSKEYNCNVVVLGHTHLATISKIDNIDYLNSGFCGFGKFQFLSIDDSYQILSGNIAS